MKIPMLKSVLICGVCAGAISVPSPMAFAQTTVERGENRVIVSVPMVPTPDKPIETGLAAVIKAKFPLSIAFGDLGAGWRELNYRSSRYFTQGETTIVNETEYLVAYVYDPNAVDNLSAKAKASANAGEKEFIAGVTGNSLSGGYAPTDRFALTLLALREVTPYLSNGAIGLH